MNASENLLLDTALDRLEILMLLRARNSEHVTRDEIAAAVLQAAAVIEQQAPKGLPGHDKSERAEVGQMDGWGHPE